MESVLMSIHPEHCRKIFSGATTIEFRRAFKYTDEPFMVFVYETKHGNMGGKVVGCFFAITLIHYFGILIFDGTSIFKINTLKIRIEEWMIFAAKAAYPSKR